MVVLQFLTLATGALATASLNALQQPHISPPKHSLFRDIVWGDINFVHTTDTHGWYAGHINQKAYSADWGDYISFASHIRATAADKGVDVLFVDTGDKHDGNGLSDASPQNGYFSTPIFNQMNYDLVTIGNHELYTEEASTQEYEISVQHYGDKYISTNVEYLLDNGTWVHFGNRYRYFTTPNRGDRILALAFLFNFRRFNSKTRVTSILDTLKEDSFKAILDAHPEEKLDYIVIFGHIPVTDLQDEELLNLHIYLRRLYPNTIIQYFGGHSHIRDFASYDYMATGLQSGRYCETLGWLSINTSDTTPKFNRRYIDFNREGLIHHAGVSKHEFDTEAGLTVSNYITDLRRELNLTDVYGYVPETYLMNAYPIGHKLNIYTLLNTTILPLIQSEIGRSDRTNRAILVNSGSIRYDLYKGNFTKDTEFIVSPFQNNWVYLTVPKTLAQRVAPYLNKGDYIMTRDIASPEKLHMQMKEQKKLEMKSMMNGMSLGLDECPVVHEKGFKKGFTTHDDYGCDGDDVHHNTIPYYPSPNIVGSYEERDPDSDMADLVFYDFIEPWILQALNTLAKESGLVPDAESYSHKDVHYYGGLSTGKLLKEHFASTNVETS